MNELIPGSSCKKVDDDNNGEEKENPTRAALDELRQTEAKLKEAMESKHETKRQWRLRETALCCSNWKMELELTKLRSEVDELDKEILATTDKTRKAHEELEVYKLRNKEEAADFWSFFQEETQKYSNLFTNAHIEYSSVCLNQDIEEYRKQSEIVREKIALVEKEMEDAAIVYGLAELGTNKETKLLKDFEAVKNILFDKGHIPRATEAAEETINVLKLKVKQKQHDIEYLKKKLYNK